MPRSKDFQKIYNSFVKRYGKNGESRYYAWLNKHKYSEEKAFPSKKSTREHQCIVHGMELREVAGTYYLEGIIASTHVYSVPDYREDGSVGEEEFKEHIPKETLEAFAAQINENPNVSGIMGLHHSEGRTGEYYGVADVKEHPAKVVSLPDGEHGLYVVTKLLDTPGAENVSVGYEEGSLNSFSITFDATTPEDAIDYSWIGGEIVKTLTPETRLFGFTAASDPVNKEAVAVAHGYREFREVMPTQERANFTINGSKGEYDIPSENRENKTEEIAMTEAEAKAEAPPAAPASAEKPAEPVPAVEEPKPEEKKEDEQREKAAAKTAAPDMREFADKVAEKVIAEVTKKMEVREKVLKNEAGEQKEVPLEVREYVEGIRTKNLDLREQFRRAAAACDKIGIDWEATTSKVESREFSKFMTNGTRLEMRGLGITTNQNTDTDYLQSGAELQDVYDPVIYNALNQATVTWNLLAKDNFAGKGNNQVQFTLKTAANATASSYTGNAVTTGNVTRLKYQTKFKKYQVGVSVDGDMIAAARGGPVSDVFAQEVMDSTMDLLAVINADLFKEYGLETAAQVIGFEYISDSAGNTTLYNLTRSSTNMLSPDSAADTYINQSSAAISMTNLRAAIRQAVTEGAMKSNLVFITAPVQGDMLRGKFDDARRLLTPRDSSFGFTTDLYVDGVPVFEDKDCNTDDWWLIDLETHRVAIWVPPTIERLGKTADSEDAFIKTYFAVYNRAPRRLVQIYGCATS